MGDVYLSLKIPDEMIMEMLCGEYRMYCKNIQQQNEFSYGVTILSAEETSCEPNGLGTMKKTFTFQGEPRVPGKYELKEGNAVWNETGDGRFYLDYKEVWPDGMIDHLKARLKCNGKFGCESTDGFIQKARKECTLPENVEERMLSKYFKGDQDAATS